MRDAAGKLAKHLEALARAGTEERVVMRRAGVGGTEFEDRIEADQCPLGCLALGNVAHGVEEPANLAIAIVDRNQHRLSRPVTDGQVMRALVLDGLAQGDTAVPIIRDGLCGLRREAVDRLGVTVQQAEHEETIGDWH